MTWVEILFLSFALAADAFAVGAGLGLAHSGRRERFRVAFHFGLFQALMPLLSGIAGAGMRRALGPWLGWVGGGLLLFLGAKMLMDPQVGLAAAAGHQGATGEAVRRSPTRGWTLVALSVSVSIDALGAGFVLGVRKAPLLGAVLVIGLTTMLLTLVGMLAGSLVGRRVGPVAARGGGVVLVLLGLAAFFQ